MTSLLFQLLRPKKKKEIEEIVTCFVTSEPGIFQFNEMVFKKIVLYDEIFIKFMSVSDEPVAA